MSHPDAGPVRGGELTLQSPPAPRQSPHGGDPVPHQGLRLGLHNLNMDVSLDICLRGERNKPFQRPVWPPRPP